MSSNLSVEVLRMILENVNKADLVNVCQVNKVCCSCSQDILYRNISVHSPQVCGTLAQSTHLARRVHSFFVMAFYFNPEIIGKALRNMSSLRSLVLHSSNQFSYILDGCTFKLDSFTSNFSYDESLRKFLNSQPSLTHIEFLAYEHEIPELEFEATCLPNLIRVSAPFSWLPLLIPGRPVSEVKVTVPPQFTEDLSFFTLSTVPVQKLAIVYSLLYPKPGHLLALNFPSLVHLTIRMEMGDTLEIGDIEWIGSLLAALVSLRSLEIEFESHSPTKAYLPSIIKASRHLEFYAIYRGPEYHCWRQLSGEWAVCSDTEFPWRREGGWHRYHFT